MKKQKEKKKSQPYKAQGDVYIGSGLGGRHQGEVGPEAKWSLQSLGFTAAAITVLQLPALSLQ